MTGDLHVDPQKCESLSPVHVQHALQNVLLQHHIVLGLCLHSCSHSHCSEAALQQNMRSYHSTARGQLAAESRRFQHPQHTFRVIKC